MQDRSVTRVEIPLRVVAQPPGSARLSRRHVMKLAFWGGMLAGAAGGVGALLNTLYPRSVEAFGGPVFVPSAAVPKPGADPVRNVAGHFFLVNLEPDEGRAHSDAERSEGGLLALWWRCPHLGCTLPWRPDAVYDDGSGRRGWVVCNCHGSTYTKAGVRVYGPAPRSMDTMRLDVDGDGNVTVQTGERRKGGDDNPRRAVPYAPPRGAASA